MELSLKGKTAFVTGGNIGIGRAVSLAFAKCGADVALTYYSHKEEGEATVKEIKAMGRNAYGFQLDATDADQVKTVVGQAAELFGGHIDILMNNAGHLVARSPIVDMTDEHWFKTINVNLTSTFFCTRAVLPFMNTGWGRIVNMSSLAARNGGGNGATAYAASKGAVIAFTRGLCKEVADQGITVNAVAPGLILETPFHETFNSDEGIKGAINATPLKRGGTPEDVANAVLYFATDLGSFITGEIVEINGGMYFA
ncbi:SDR family NAD(P)-dependent oxidoreductase [Desulforhopalus sp. IMCC35007]|uniref:SDR family NAD(P)-dependent oxidoreductase n=1 Tax=Desulforhopalus sp. IMCC35007 TaxID=2569543 RepID=UPI0010ADD755|nr:SDR family NAD(P)-dependent oxidoreductase [Desulforhopalus sp. IMCC35007]TKB06905.1 SDR family oxidoreductase [Desulforhopalus sp. IMCC35007]